MDLSSYALVTLHQDSEFVLCRGRRTASPTSDPASVLVTMTASESPAPDRVRMLENELALRAELDSAWALRPLVLSHYGGRSALILEDQQGEPLTRLLASPPVSLPPEGARSSELAMELGLFLRLAVALAGALGEVHRRGFVHKNVKPSNVLVNTATGQVWLTGFGIASRLPRERQAPEPPEMIAGTLAYMAPEQTGRMNRSIDTRSDLYSLGVTLYQLLTGALPFTATDPIGWVHCHIARQPTAMSERVAEVPAPVSAIVMKLLAKTGEERYQTAAGLERDLRRCLAQWEAERHIDDFPLGEHDTSDRLLIPEKLYGRAREVEALLAAFDRVVRGGVPELVLVSGYSGIGKSSVVNELHKVLVPPRALFVAGKFDQDKRDIPYSTLAQAFEGLIRPLLTKGEDELGRWRNALRDALGPNGQLVVGLVPDLKVILGEQPAVPDLPPRDAQRRLQFVLRRFLGVFARPEHPLALFLDDLQWLDAATLDLLQDLLIQGDVRHLLLIGAYRDNEVTPTHPLMRCLEVVRSTGGAPVQELALAPLGREDLSRLIEDSLHCDAERATPLAQLLHEKTGGNPFFAIQFLSALVEEGLVTFDHAEGRWCWDLTRIHEKGYTDNVIDLMVGKLHSLPVDTQRAVRQLACLGKNAGFAELAMVFGNSRKELDRDLQSALRIGLVLPSGDSFRFVHDRVQEAAYSLIPDTQRTEAHLRIGRLLLAHTPPGEREGAIFDIVHQLNRGAALIASQDEREQLAELNLIAGQRAKRSAAFASALSYFATGAALLAEDCWERRHDLAFGLELNRAECEYSTGQTGPAEEHLTALAPHADGVVERAAIARRRMDLYHIRAQADRAIGVGLDFLRDTGVEWSPHPSEEELRHEYERIGSLLGSRAIEDLIDLPVLSDPSSLATLDVLATLAVPAHAFDNNLHGLVNCRAVSLSIERGNCEASCFAYVWLGAIAGAQFGDYQAGYRFARVGFELGERRGWKSLQPATYLVFGSVILPWARHVKDGRDLIHRAIESATSIGDLHFAVGSGPLLNTNMLAAGDHLAEVERVTQRHLEMSLQAGFGLTTAANAGQLAFVRTLRGMTPTFGCLDGDQFEEEAAEHRFAGDSNLQHAECWYWIRKLQARFLAGDYAAAMTSSSRAEPLLWTAKVVFEAAEYHLYSALARAAICDAASGDERRQHLVAMGLHQRQLDIWARNCPENFENRAFLVAAEIARIEGREVDAERLYEDAIRSAHGNEFVHNEALANELAARFYAGRGFERIARAYLRAARDGYRHWGADGKVRQLEMRYPYLTDEQPSPDPTRTMVTPVEHLDLSTVLKLSQAVQGETNLEKLVAAIMRLGLEHAGAQRGLLILPYGDAYRVEAEARSGHEGVTVDLRQIEAGPDDLPPLVLQYVLRTRERVLLPDATAEHEFEHDGYLRRHRARSVLCMPLVKQTRIAGILYLENNLMSGAFTPQRMALLEVLASDAAISLENARLYREISELRDQLYVENLVLRDEVDRTSMFEEIVGTSSALQPVLARVEKVARTDSTVLLTGETGTGKELVARAIHRRSARASRAFVSVNCAAVPRELIASELFGHEKGAFTGATQRRLGRFELAHGGTIFLDEVGDLPMETQIALLRVLQERELERVGGSEAIRIDVRVIAATNRDLQAAIDDGVFRNDLFYRLNVFPIPVPSLRERADDIPLLVEYFIDRYARKAGKTIRRVNKRTLDQLRTYPWPGNVRELQNVVERSVILCDTDEFRVDGSWLPSKPKIEGRVGLPGTLAAHERVIIEDALRASGGRIFGPAGAAERLGIPRSTLESRIRTLRINKGRFRKRPAQS